MGNIFSLSHNKNMYKPKTNIYEPFVNEPTEQMQTQQLQKLIEQNRMLEEEVKILKRELDMLTTKIDISIQNKYNELLNSIKYYNEKNNEKINIITKDMENLLNNDKILLDKLIEKNIVSIIQDT